MTVNTKFVQTPAVALYSGLSVAGTSMRITPFPVDLDGTKLTMTDFGTTGYATIDPKVSGYEEIVSFTGITDNGDGTATLTGLVRDLLSKYPYTTPGTGKLHGSSAVVVFSDNPQLYAKFAAKDNDETITGRWGTAVVPTNATDYVNKLYADTLATGIATYAANIVAGVAGENLISGNIVYLKASDGKWYIADSATASKSVGVQLGIVQATALSGVAITVLIGGLDAKQTGLTAGSVYYLGVAGAISTTKGANIRLVGQVPNGSTTTLVINFASSDPEIMIVDGSRTYVADTGAADAYVMTLVPAITAYKAGQIFSFKAVNANLTTSPTLNINGLGAKSIKKVNGSTALAAGDIAAGQLIVVEYDGTNFQMVTPVGNAPVSSAQLRFGGTGADGALAISSGATNIDVGGVQLYVLNYTSISITGTGSLTFSNPSSTGTIIVIKSQGNVTLTSSTAPMIDCSGMGAAGGAGGAGAISPAAPSAGSNGNTGIGITDDLTTHPGGAGTAAVSATTAGAASTGGTILSSVALYSQAAYQLSRRSVVVACGSGGGGGGGGSAQTSNIASCPTGATGGRGGGGLIIECAGALNFTTALGISVAGKVGGTGANGADTLNTDASIGGAAGGGGSGGFAVVLYNTLTSASGTINSAGGAGGLGGDGVKTHGTSGTQQCCSGTGGAGAGSDGGVGGAGATGSANANGNNGSAGGGQRAGGGGGSGGSTQSNSATRTGGTGGAAGASAGGLVAQNIWFA